MKPIAIVKAQTHLDLAKAAAKRLHLGNGQQAYENAWADFIAQASRFYSKMEQGSKGLGKSEAWFGRKKRERKTDQLLSYVHHARDCEEHGLDYIMAKTGSRLNVHMAEGATEVHASIHFMVDSKGKFHVREPATNTPNAITAMELIDPRMELVPVTDSRFGDTFDPPKEHLGTPIDDPSPAGVAGLMIEYLEAFLEEARRLPPLV